TLTDEDQKAGPSGEGWVFQMLGYTFNADSKKFITEQLLANLQRKSMRDKGFSHACIFWYERNPRWSPKLGSAAAKRPRIMEVLKVAYSPSVAGGPGTSGSGEGGMFRGGRSGGLGGSGMEGPGAGGLSGVGLSGAGAGGPPSGSQTGGFTGSGGT